MEGVGIVAIVLFVIFIVFVVQTIKVVPQQHAWIVERLGKYHAHARAGAEHRRSRSSTASPTSTR